MPYNPVINVYRRIAREVRTPDEKPLTFWDIDRFKSNFGEVSHQEFWLTTLSVFLKFYLIDRANPEQGAVLEEDLHRRRQAGVVLRPAAGRGRTPAGADSPLAAPVLEHGHHGRRAA